MAKSRIEKFHTDDEAESQAERSRFEELADQYRQQGHLPPGGDQSWREREAMRRAAYDKGYTPPPGDPSWREREAAQRAANREPVQEPVEEPVHEADIAATAADVSRDIYAWQEPQPFPVTKSGQGGTVLIFLLVAAITIAVAALAYPQVITAAYWRTPQTDSSAPAPAQPAQTAQPVQTPVSPPDTPPVQQPAPDSNAAPAPPVEQAPPPAPDMNAAPAAPAEETTPPPVTAPEANPVEAPKPKLKPRASAREDQDTGGFYAKVPGPDGTMEYKYFSAHPDTDSGTQAQQEPAVPDTGGFYAKAPGPDGTMQYRYFPRVPKR